MAVIQRFLRVLYGRMTKNMVEPETGVGQDPTEFLEEAYNAGQDSLREQVADTFISAGYDPDDVQELLYDPAPRRRGKHRRHKRRAATYDPAPRKRKKGRKAKSAYPKKTRKAVSGKARSALSKFKKYAFPVAAGGSFIMQYAARADALKASGLITTGGYAGVLEALKYDLTNFNATDAMNRVSANISTIAVPLAGGYIVKNVVGGMVKGSMEKDITAIAGDLLMGYGVAVAAKKVLDPPIVAPRPTPSMRAITTPQPQIPAQSAWRV